MNCRRAILSRPGAPRRHRALAEITEIENLDRIADGLAQQGWMVIDDFFGPELTSALRHECRTLNTRGDFHDAAIGGGERRHIRSDIRGDKILWMQHPGSSEAQRDCLDRFEQLRLALNRTLQLGLFDFESHFARYPEGAFYARHVDQLRGDHHRKLSCVLYLNENWSPDAGGELRLYLNDGGPEFEDVLPRGGRLVVFLSAQFAHEVLAAKRERMSIAGWFRTR